MFSGGAEDDHQQVLSSNSRQQAPVSRGLAQPTTPADSMRQLFQRSLEGPKMIIAVDARPRRAGGILKFQDDSGRKYLWYYSVDWDTCVNFSNDPFGQKPDRMELANALLAAYIAEDAFTISDSEAVIFKLDNDVAVNRRKHPEIANKIAAIFDGRSVDYQKVTKDTDTDMKNADMLSRGEYFKFDPKQRYPDFAVRSDKSDLASTYLRYVVQHLPPQNLRSTAD